MEYSACKELVQEMVNESFIDQWMMDLSEGLRSATLPMATACPDNDHFHGHDALLCGDHQPPIISTPSPEDYCLNINRPTKQLKANSWDFIYEPTPCTELYNKSQDAVSVAAASTIFYPPSPYGEFTLDGLYHHLFWNNESTYAMGSGKLAMSRMRNTSASAKISGSKDHVIAERRRREKLGQMFIALSAIIPGLKKTDKASVLTDAVNYIKKLQERVKTLEEKMKNKTFESVKISRLLLIDDSFINDVLDHEELPQIEARVSDKDVLIRVHCENKKGVIEKVLSEISNLNLIIGNTSVLAFGCSALDITIVATMDGKCCVTMKELVKSLHGGFKEFHVKK